MAAAAMASVGGMPESDAPAAEQPLGRAVQQELIVRQLLARDEEAILARVRTISMSLRGDGIDSWELQCRAELVVWCFLGLTRPIELVLPYFTTFDYANPLPSVFNEAFPDLATNVSPVAAAAEGGQAAVLKYLFAHGASADHEKWLLKAGDVAPHALHFATTGEVANILLDKLGPYNKSGAGGLLDWGVAIGRKRLIGTPLQTLALRGKAEAVRALLKRGASVFEADADRTGVLSWACLGTTGRTAEVVDLLLSFNCPVNIQNKDGRSALHHAVRRAMADPEKIPVVELLLEHGADVHAQDKSGHTPLCLSLVPPPAAAEQDGMDARARRSNPATYAVAALLVGRGARLFECTPSADWHDGHEPMCHLGLSVRSKSAVLAAAVSVARAKAVTLSDVPVPGSSGGGAGAAQPHPALVRFRDARRALGDREAAFSASCGSGTHALAAWRAATAAVRTFAAESRAASGAAAEPAGAPAKGRGKRGRSGGVEGADGGDEQARAQAARSRRKVTGAGAAPAASQQQEQQLSGAAAECSARAAELTRLLSEMQAARAALAATWADTAVAVAGMVAARTALQRAESALSDAREHHAQSLSQLEKELEKVGAVPAARSGPAAAAAAAAAVGALADGEEDWGGDDNGSDSSMVMGWSAFGSSSDGSSDGSSSESGGDEEMSGDSDDDDDDDDDDGSGSISGDGEESSSSDGDDQEDDEREDG